MERLAGVTFKQPFRGWTATSWWLVWAEGEEKERMGDEKMRSDLSPGR